MKKLETPATKDNFETKPEFMKTKFGSKGETKKSIKNIKADKLDLILQARQSEKMAMCELSK